MGIMRDGVRRMEPYLEAQITKIGLWEVTLSPMYTKSGKTRTFWMGPKTWKADSQRGYWARAILPELGRGRGRDEIHVALSRYMARRNQNEHHLGAESDGASDVSGTPEPPATPRKYPSGRRLLRADRMQSMDNTPTSLSGAMECWDFNSRATCAKGDKCPNDHENFNGKNPHLTLNCELMRRGAANAVR